eukprot:PhF_6_TR5710/c1_g1_i1/m.8415
MPYEHIPHTADVMFHVWNPSLSDLFEECITAFTSVLVGDVKLIQVDETKTFDIDVSGKDLSHVLYHVLDECVYAYGSTYTVIGDIRVFDVVVADDDDGTCHVKARAWGERYDPSRHAGGTEVKAMTFHNLTVEKRKFLPG